MSSPGYIADSPSGDVTLKDHAVYQNPSLLKHKFSIASYKIGLMGDNLAKRLHESRYLYATYGALDGLSNICSHWRFVFDLMYNDSVLDPDDKLHEFLSSPEGMAIVGIETIATMAYATIGNYYDPNDKNRPFLGFLALTWPYVRDCFKGSKNAFKGIRATLNIGSFLSGTSLIHYVFPAAIVFGFLAIIDRLLMRYMGNQRKNMMKNNKQVWQDIQDLDAINLSPNELEQQGIEIFNKIQKQSKAVRALSFLGASYGGFIDGLYLYVGIVTLLGVSGLVWLTAPVALFLIGCSVLYGLTNIATRVYEEYDYQKKLDISVSKANLALIGKKIECVYHTLRQSKEQKLSTESHNKLKEYVDMFVKQREELRDLSLLSYKQACILGITHGLAAYGAIACFMFAVSTVTFLIMQTMPPVLLISIAITIASGLLLMAAFATNAIYRTYQHRQKLDEFESLEASKNLKELRELVKIEKGEVIANKPDEEIEATLNDCMVIDGQPLFFYMEIFEVVRSFFSGVGKGPKSIMTTFNAFQEKGDDGNYHFDNWILLAFTSASSVIYAVCLALRAYARGFGRPPIDQIEPKSPKSDSPLSPETSPSPKNTLKRSQSSMLGMFAKKPEENHTMHKSHSDSKLYSKTSQSMTSPLPSLAG